MSYPRIKTAREQRAQALVGEILQKLAAPKGGHDGPDLPERPELPEAPSAEPVEPPKPPKPSKSATPPKPIKQTSQSQSGALQGTLRGPKRKM